MIYHRQSQELLTSSKHGRIPLRGLKQELGGMAAQLYSDRKCDFFKIWGQSINVDEYAGELIVPPQLLNLVGRAARFPIRARVHASQAYHAGLMHTYGYLLSTLATPYGFKHERWTDGEIERGLGLRCSLWSPDDEYSLFQNLSYLLSGIVESNGGNLKKTNRDFVNVCPEILGYDFASLQIQSLVEAVQAGKKKLRLKSRVVDLPKLKRQKLLVYSHQSGMQPEQLITCFPIAKKMADDLLSSDLGDNQPIRLRYNAYWPAFPDDALGSRLVFNWS